MNVWYEKHYSEKLGRDMECKVYGYGGIPVLFIPCQDGRFFDFENFRMADAWQPWIDGGKVQVFSVDVLDGETLTSKDWDKARRIGRYEAWVSYIVEEFVPWMCYVNGSGKRPMTFGCSLGALHAANLYFRFPDVFGAVLALSGLYDLDYYFGGYRDELVYRNSPVHYLSGMHSDHPYIGKYNAGKMIFCVGQGDWEWETKEYTANLEGICRSKGIQAQFHYWGYDVKHDWDWWFKQVAVYLPQFLEE